MASDLSSVCTEAIGVLDEKEEGEISLEDVSSSEEGHLNYGYGIRAPQCSNCLSTQHNATWCTAPVKSYHSKGSNRREVDLILQDAVQGKENRHQIKEAGCTGTKHTTSTLQEKNDDLVPISSDSDMEIVGLADNSKQILINSASKTRVKKKKKRKRTHASLLTMDDLVSTSAIDASVSEPANTLKHDIAKNNPRSHHREISPIHRGSRSRAALRSPPRKHRSLIRTHSPFKRSKSPLIRARSPTVRRSPRRIKSPKRSPYRSPGKSMPRKTSHLEVISSSHNYIDTQKLLKKVRHLESIGTHSLEETLNKNKEHASSLKEKLTNMMKGVCDNNNEMMSASKERSNTHVNKKEQNDVDDDEDLALLRQKALETKQKKSSKQNDQPKTDTAKKLSANIDDDQDEEDLELRMIALRSAVLKKHQNRVQKSMKSGKYKRSNTSRSESPFTQSFLDSIPIPGEELLDFASPPHTPLPMGENNHTEDMELDTDVEREKEKLPYSPTDKITVNIPMDTELLGIQPSDVSFINLNEANNSPNFNMSITSSHDDQKSYQEKIIENRSYLPNVVYCASSQNALYATTNASMQYTPTDPTKIPRPEFIKVHNSHVNAYHYENTSNILKNTNTSILTDINSSQEMPYSPTDTPVYDPDLSHALPQTLGPITTSNSSLVSMGSPCTFNTHENNEQYNHVSQIQQTQTTGEVNDANEDENLDKVETLSMVPVVGSAATSARESVSPSSSMITIDDLPETEADASPLVDSLKNIKGTECIPSNLTDNIKEAISEPLYMKGIPDVTKDVNKIPTLINRTLVPAPILKTNKQLQQPLPVRKSTVQQEPTFKSAEMQPVIINDGTSTKANTSFKPMKLMSFPQKSHSVLAVPTAFYDSLHEDAANEILANENTSLVEGNDNAIVVQNNGPTNEESLSKTCDNMNTIQKRKKFMKKGLKRKSTDSVTKEPNATSSNNDNIDTVNKQLSKITELAHRNDTEDNKEFKKCKTNKGQPDRENSVNISNAEVLQNIVYQEDHISSEKNLAVKQIQDATDRRQSLDEDEEALRAILLASLPKRTKSVNSISNSSTITTIPTVSNSKNEMIANQSIPKVVSSMVNTVNATKTNSTTVLSTLHLITGSENDRNRSNSGEKISNTITQGSSVPFETVKTSASITSGRKRSVPVNRGLQKKLVKRIAIPASTKVVNNAKKYQNTMMQKKLNLQKAALYSKQKTAESKTVSKLRLSDNKWAAKTKISLSDTQRIIINLESDTESDSESEQQRKQTVPLTNSLTADKHQPSVKSRTEFEKNLDQFLQAVRKKQESMAAARPTSVSQTPKKDTVLTTKPENSSNLHTPLAVRHLPASQQEEYRRLKQQIIEREKLKLNRTVENNSSVKNKNVELSSKSVSSKSPSKEPHSKLNEIVSGKSQSAHVQQINKENCSKNLDSIKTTSILPANNIQPLTTRTHIADKQGNISPNQLKMMSKTITNLNICISNESNSNNGGNKIGNSLQSVATSRQVFDPPTNDISTKLKLSPGLKILSTDEVNRKYVQIQVKNDTNERVVTINDKVTLNNKTVINQNENVSGSKDTTNKDAHDDVINQFIQSVEKEITTTNTQSDNNDIIDSDASTVILARENHNAERSLDTSESTIRLSQYEDGSQTSSILNAESKDDGSFSLCNNNVSDDKTTIEKNWEAIKRDVKTELNALITLPRGEQEKHLMDTEQKLVLKRYTILDELAEMSGNLRQWHMERDLQTNLVAEVKKLREQLKVAEERLQQQRNRINNIGPRVVAAHGKINAGRHECYKLATICSTLGSRIVGKEYKVPEAGAQLLDSRLKEVANHTRQLSRKKVPSIDIPEVHETTKVEEDNTTCLEMSESENLLIEESNVDNVNTTVLNEHECSTILNAVEEDVSTETATVDLSEINKQEEHVATNNLPPSIDDENVLQQSNTEKEVFMEQPGSSSTSDATNAVPVSTDSQASGQKKLSEDKTVRLGSALESNNQNVRQTKRTILPYESILTHFKVPRNANPNGVLCPYELMGTCNDGDCQFVHQRGRQDK